MTSATLHELGVLLVTAIVMGFIAWRIWRRGQTRLSALEDALLKRTPEGWTFNSPYPRIFSRRRWTYLLADAQKERLVEGLRCWVRAAALAVIGLCAVVSAILLAFRHLKQPDPLSWLLAGSPGVWLLLCLLFVLAYGMVATAVLIGQKALVHPVLRDARRIGPAGPVSPIRLMAETTSIRELRRRIIGIALALLACGLLTCVATYLSRSLDAELLLVMAVSFGLLAVWYVALLVVKLRAQRLAR